MIIDSPFGIFGISASILLFEVVASSTFSQEFGFKVDPLWPRSFFRHNPSESTGILLFFEDITRIINKPDASKNKKKSRHNSKQKHDACWSNQARGPRTSNVSAPTAAAAAAATDCCLCCRCCVVGAGLLLWSGNHFFTTDSSRGEEGIWRR